MDELSFLNSYTASAFADESVVERYDFRPKNHPSAFPLLADLCAGTPKRVLDIGCGTGFICRELVNHVESVDAVDISEPMLRVGKTLPNGAHKNLNWILGGIEDVDLTGKYGLVTAGSSFHWFDWAVTVPKLTSLLHEDGVLALVQPKVERTPWSAEIQKLVAKYSTLTNYVSFDMPQVMSKRGYWQEIGRITTDPMPFQQPIDHYIQSWHARSSFSLERMTPENAKAFDDGVREILGNHVSNSVTLQVRSRIVWGKLIG